MMDSHLSATSLPFECNSTRFSSPSLEASSTYICPQDVERMADQDQPSPSVTDDSSLSPDDDLSSQPKKKRKSWGQVLPEPTTNLPPRKRAKTEAEKEQRKYERVQRNRQAAHNSRMRKQEEMDNLSKKNTELERQCQQQSAEIERLKKALGLSTIGQPPLSPTLSHAGPPSLDSASPSDTSSTDYDQAATPLMDIKLEHDHGFEMKFDDSHSAVDVEHPLGTIDFATTDFMKDLQSSSSYDVNLAYDNFLNLDGLSNSTYSDHDMSWNIDLEGTPAFDASFMDPFAFDPKSTLSHTSLEPLHYDNIDSAPFNNTTLDPPMFTLPGQGA